jgi:hypothetical protein
MLAVQIFYTSYLGECIHNSHTSLSLSLSLFVCVYKFTTESFVLFLLNNKLHRSRRKMLEHTIYLNATQRLNIMHSTTFILPLVFL